MKKYIIYTLLSTFMAIGCSLPEENFSETSEALSSLTGKWEGFASWEGPPQACPLEGTYGIGACDHEVTLSIGCSGNSGYALYFYPKLNLSCQSNLSLIEDNRVSYWQESDTFCGDQSSEKGRVSLGPVTLLPSGLKFRWERDVFFDHDTVGTIHKTSNFICL